MDLYKTITWAHVFWVYPKLAIIAIVLLVGLFKRALLPCVVFCLFLLLSQCNEGGGISMSLHRLTVI